MGGHKSITSSKHEPLPPKPVDYNVTGALSPDATCNYLSDGWYNAKLYYRRQDGEFFIWWHLAPDGWYISRQVGVQGTAYWTHFNPIVRGVYAPKETAEGLATVEIGEH